MFKRNLMLINVCLYVITVLYNIDNAYAAKCSRIPEGSSNNYRSISRGTFRVRIKDDSTVYKPGRTYTVRIEQNSNKGQARQTFTGFFLAVEQKKNSSSDVAEEFQSSKHGAFKIIEGDALTKLVCGNVATHQSDSSKQEVEINWTAPSEPGSGCVVFRATIIEHRENWYKDEGLLTKEFCADEEVQEDFISNVLDTCCACTEAKYELTFEGLWSRNTHPIGFPRNAFETKFGDIIGATHTKDETFWINGDLASDGLKEVADTGSTQTLEKELKNKSDSIRTIIKARGLAYPNVTGKTFAVFRVDWVHHLVSFISMISPSPDWFVGISNFELCQEDCSWVESKTIDLYPWDAGTDKGTTYDSPDQPARRQEPIRRILSDIPIGVDSPFLYPGGVKMKPLARLTLLRQRLYEKNCSASQTDDNDDNAGYDSTCVLSYYDTTGCRPNCTKAQYGRYPQDKRKECEFRPQMGPRYKEVSCTGGRCQPGYEQINNQEQPEENNGNVRRIDENIECTYTDWEDSTQCNTNCGRGTKNQMRKSNDARCKETNQQVDCFVTTGCKNKEHCRSLPLLANCVQNESGDSNWFFYYNSTSCSCNQVFSSTCKPMRMANMFEKYDDCKEQCPEDCAN